MRTKVAHTNDPKAPWTQEDNASFLQDIVTASDGEIKLASTASSVYTRRILRESQFTQHLLPERNITQNEMLPLIPGANSQMDVNELGVILCSLEPGNPGARTVSLETASEQDTYRGAWYTVAISKDEIPELVKNVDKLALYKDIDLRQVVTDNALRELDNLPDYRLVGTIREITGSDPLTAGAGGYLQYREVSGGLTRATLKNLFRPLIDANLINSAVLMSRATALEFLSWTRDEMGGDASQTVLTNGTQGLGSFTFNAVPFMASIKASLLPLGEVITFAPPNFLGQNLILQPAQLWVKRERDTISVYACCKRGAHIANTSSVARTRYLNL